MFMTTFKNRALLERDDDDDDIMPNGSHPMTFRDIASLQLDMYESGDMTDSTIAPRCLPKGIVEAKVTSPKWNSWLILKNDNDGIEEIAEAEDTRLTRLSPGNHVDVEEIAEVEKREEYNMKVPASKLKQVHSVK
ncbi:hypothetical protein POM88_027861 [Heracleum sosnowskyi]|uniref:Uncharacterized protein n=1 Tax=Heracleum sosnowskyi TaxID=360622 RepID=A0AAD8IAT5_9APIA|nr:hypothetical protein POM88_027861 [Heracleum sosnowskyi]